MRFRKNDKAKIQSGVRRKTQGMGGGYLTDGSSDSEESGLSILDKGGKKLGHRLCKFR